MAKMGVPEHTPSLSQATATVLPRHGKGLRRDRLVLLSLLVVRDVEELDLVALLGGGDDAEPVTQLLLAQVLLGQVLEVALREGNVGVDPDLALTYEFQGESGSQASSNVRMRETLAEIAKGSKPNAEVEIEDERA